MTDTAQDFDVVKRLLAWAKNGLKLLIVHGTRELKNMSKKLYAYYPRAAVSTQGLDGKDAELAKLIQELVSLPTVSEVDDPADTVKTLRRLGIHGRAEFASENRNILTHLRDDGDKLYLFVYHFLYDNGKPTDVRLSVQGEGAVFRVDADGPSVRPISAAVEGGRTKVCLHLLPGETALLVIDCSETPKEMKPPKIEKIDLSDKWSLTVESWGAGEVKEIKEDRGLGYETVEHRPHVKVTKIEVGHTELRSWRQISQVGDEHSGIGEYTQTMNLPSTYDTSKRAVLDLGSTSGGLGSVRVNDSAPRGFDTAVPRVDVTGLLQPGENHLKIRVATSLNNRLMADGYYKRTGRKSLVVGEWPPGDDGLRVRDYGLIGPVTLAYE